MQHALTVAAEILGVGAVVTFIGAWLIERAHPPRGRFIDNGGLRQHVVELGASKNSPIPSSLPSRNIWMDILNAKPSEYHAYGGAGLRPAISGINGFIRYHDAIWRESRSTKSIRSLSRGGRREPWTASR